MPMEKPVISLVTAAPEQGDTAPTTTAPDEHTYPTSPEAEELRAKVQVCDYPAHIIAAGTALFGAMRPTKSAEAARAWLGGHADVLDAGTVMDRRDLVAAVYAIIDEVSIDHVRYFREASECLEPKVVALVPVEPSIEVGGLDLLGAIWE